jgi:transposase, IS605 orfB family|nr:MAG TPA: endonuclease [Caudoviricetes sp.]
MAYKVQKIFVNPRHALFKALDNYAFLSKNLYNSTLYRHRQDYKAKKKKISWMKLVGEFASNNKADYRAIPAKVAQKIVKAVDDEYKSYFSAKKAGLKANLPRYKHKTEGRYKITFNYQCLSDKFLKQGILKLPAPKSFTKELKFKIPKNIIGKIIKEVTVTKFNDGYMVIICYKDETEVKTKEGNNVASIDLGLNNLVACVSNNEMKPFLISGCPINSFNHEWNKKAANLKSKLDTSKDEGEKKAIKDKINYLNRRRNNKVNDYLHKASTKLVNHLDSNQINSLIIGYNQGWKQDINLGKKVNQKFGLMPFYKFLDMLKYKCITKGITVKIQEESYTSKCSFLGNEEVCKHDSYLGKRVKRGLFRSSTGAEINADINGAYNILVKAIGKFNYRPIQVCGLPSTLKV